MNWSDEVMHGSGRTVLKPVEANHSVTMNSAPGSRFQASTFYVSHLSPRVNITATTERRTLSRLSARVLAFERFAAQ